MTTHRITPSWSIQRRGDTLTVQTSHKQPHALIHGGIDAHTAGALRALADEIERGGVSRHVEHDGQEAAAE